MKIVVVAVVFILLAVGGSYAYTSIRKQPPSQTSKYTTETQTYTGTIQVVNPPGDDYTHVLISRSGTIKLNSQRLSLSRYIGKAVKVAGQYSGNTLYVDTIEDAVKE